MNLDRCTAGLVQKLPRHLLSMVLYMHFLGHTTVDGLSHGVAKRPAEAKRSHFSNRSLRRDSLCIHT